jgi:hypothetical protein
LSRRRAVSDCDNPRPRPNPATTPQAKPSSAVPRVAPAWSQR